MEKQRLVSGSVPWRGNQRDAPIAEYIGITVDELKVLRRAEQLTRQRHQLIDVVVRPVGGMYPTVFSPLHHDCGVGEQPDVTDVVSVRMRYGNTADVAGLQADVGKLICQ